MYKVLYRKYRPRSFSDVVGQEAVSTTLKNEVFANKVAHAYLFVGSRGTGKTSCAKILSKAVNCLNPKDGDACLSCESCLEIENETSLDVLELDAATNNSVNDIRSICENSNFTPIKAKYRVYIIDEIHMLSQGAFAALLKTLEEPVDRVIFILATTEVHKLPATIFSRCQRFLFKRLDVKCISQRLLDISSKEGINLTKEAAVLLAKQSDGALRDALSLMESLVFSKEKITEEVAGKIIGTPSKKTIYETAGFISKKELAPALEAVSNLFILSENLSKVLENLIEIFKNALILKSTDNISFLSLTKSEEEKTRNISLCLSSCEILSILKILEDGFINLTKRTNTKLELDLAVIKACNLGTKNDTLNHENLSFGHAETKIAPRKKEDTEIKNEFADNEIKISNAWPKILKELSLESKVAAMSLMGSEIFDENGNILIHTKNAVAKNFLKGQNVSKKILDLTKKFTGKNFKKISFKEKGNEKTVKNFVKKAKEQGIEVIEKGI